MFQLIILTCLIASAVVAINTNNGITEELEKSCCKETNATIDDIPYQVSIWNGSIATCSGSLLSDEWVITAASCIDLKNNYQIRINSNNSNSGGKLLDVRMSYKHPLFENNTDFDVGLIRLVKSDNKGMQFIRRPKCSAGKIKSDDYLEVTGYGLQMKNNKTHLISLRLPVIKNNVCSTYKADKLISDILICAGYIGDEIADNYSCKSDPGASMTFKGDLAGIFSAVMKCNKPNDPGVFTDILTSETKEWVNRVTKINMCENK